MMSGQPMTVIKIGGRFAEDDASILSLAGELKNLGSRGNRVLLVHGGGVVISQIQEKYGVVPRFIQGLRQTSPEEMPLVDMALAGSVNKRLVRLFIRAGITAWGLCGADAGILQAESITGDSAGNRTGRVTSADIRPLEYLWKGGYMPVFAPPASDSKGLGINVNADEAALALAAALKARHLVFFSDVPGVLEENQVVRHLTPDTIRKKIAESVITGGMIPKVESAAGALDAGIGAVFIADYTGPGDLRDTVAGLRGTRIDKESK
jgi:acetylglutamate kinase